MKRISFVICIVALLGSSFMSCSNSPEESARILRQKENNIKNISRDTTVNHHNRWSADVLVSENPEIFGTDVLIFDSLPCADTLLDKLTEAEYVELRDLYTDLGIINPIIESNIIYDSVMEAVALDLHVDLESDTLSESTLAWFLERFVDIMMTDYSESCVVGEYLDTNQEFCYTVNPLGNIDERALCNEKGLFIAGDVVFKYSGNYLLTCPADIYLELAGYDDLEELLYDFNAYGISGVTETDFMVSALEDENDLDVYQGIAMRPNNNYVDDHFRKYTGTNQDDADKKVVVTVTVYPYWSWFTTNFRCKMTITNYYKNTKLKAKVQCNFRAGGHGWYYNSSHELYFHRYRHGLVNIFGLSINDYFKSRTFLDEDYTNSYWPTTQTCADINFVDLSLVQNDGYPWGIVLTVNSN